MYLIVAFAITVLVIALAWRGVGVTHRTGDDSGEMRGPARTPRPPKPQPRRYLAPDDDPDFLSEIDRRLREEGKNNS